MRYLHTFLLAVVLACAGCAELPFVMQRPAYVPAVYDYVGGADGGHWLRIKQRSRTDYVLELFAGGGPKAWLVRLEGSEPLPEGITTGDLNYWDGSRMRLLHSRAVLKRIRGTQW